MDDSHIELLDGGESVAGSIQRFRFKFARVEIGEWADNGKEEGELLPGFRRRHYTSARHC